MPGESRLIALAPLLAPSLSPHALWPTHPSFTARASRTSGGELSCSSTSSSLARASFSAGGRGVMGGARSYSGIGPAPSAPTLHWGVPPSVSNCSLLLCRALISQASRCFNTCKKGDLSVRLSSQPPGQALTRIMLFIHSTINSMCSSSCAWWWGGRISSPKAPRVPVYLSLKFHLFSLPPSSTRLPMLFFKYPGQASQPQGLCIGPFLLPGPFAPK